MRQGLARIATVLALALELGAAAVDLRASRAGAGWSLEHGAGLAQRWAGSAWGRILGDPQHLGWRWRLEQAGYTAHATSLPPGASRIADWFLGADGSWELTTTATGIRSSVHCTARPVGLVAIDPTMLQWIPAGAAGWVAVGVDGPSFLASAPEALRQQLLSAVAGLGEGWLPGPAEDLLAALRGTLVCAVVPGRVLPGITLALPRSPSLDRLLGEVLTKLEARPADGDAWRVALLGDWWQGRVEREERAWTLRSDAALAWGVAAPDPGGAACLCGRWDGPACAEMVIQACDLLAAQAADPDRQERLMGLVDALVAGWGDGAVVLEATPDPCGRCDALPLSPLLLAMLLADGAWAPAWREFASNDELAAARLRRLLLPGLNGAATLRELLAKHAPAGQAPDGAWDGYRYRHDVLPAGHAAAWVCYAWPADPPRSGRRCWALLADGRLFSQVLADREPDMFELWGGPARQGTIAWAEHP